MKIGDKVKHHLGGDVFTITDISISVMYLLLDNFPHYYSCNQYSIVSQDEQKKENICNHEFIDVGFRFIKEICKHCNEDKVQNV